MTPLLLGLAPAFAGLDWIAVARQNKPLEYLAKPAVMLALLAWLYAETGFAGPAVWFAAALVFSLVGDIFLMLPGDRFIPGLAAFLTAHVLYIIGFTRSLPPANLPALVLALLVTLAAGMVYRRVREAILESGRPRLQYPVLLYTNVISLMLLTALLTLLRDEWSGGAALLASLGALLFFISDGLLAWNKFVTPLRNGKLLVHMAYHTGQILLTLAAALQYGLG
jgi:uncharacterized membrane protein YhhN